MTERQVSVAVFENDWSQRTLVPLACGAALVAPIAYFVTFLGSPTARQIDDRLAANFRWAGAILAIWAVCLFWLRWRRGINALIIKEAAMGAIYMDELQRQLGEPFHVRRATRVKSTGEGGYTVYGIEVAWAP